MSSWDGVAGAYRTSFALLCGGTVERLLSDTAGPLHLDVGSGTGALAAAAAGLGRTVVAVDADPTMVAMTSAAVDASVLEAALPALPFPDAAFDAVTANFVVNHVADPRSAVVELARVTRRGGRVAATIWPARPAAWSALVGAAFEAARVVPVPAQRLSPELDFDRSVEGLSDLLEGAGLEACVATELSWTWRIDADALWAGVTGGVATAGQTYLAQPPEVRAAADQAFRARTSGMLELPCAAAYVVAAKP